MNTFILDIYEHNIGDKHCPKCIPGYPKLCHCGGLIHAEFDVDKPEILITKCDKCDIQDDKRIY